MCDRRLFDIKHDESISLCQPTFYSWKYFKEEGSYKTPEMNLDDQDVMLPLDTSLVGGGEV